MAFRTYVVAVVLFVAVVGVAFATLQITDTARGEANRIQEFQENESISQEVGIWQFVNKAVADDTAGFNDNVTVYNSTGVELERGTDYEWNESDGKINYKNTPKVTDGNVGNISYVYFRNTPDVNALSGLIDWVVNFVSWSPLLVGGLGLGVLLLFAAAFFSRVLDRGGRTVERRR